MPEEISPFDSAAGLLVDAAGPADSVPVAVPESVDVPLVEEVELDSDDPDPDAGPRVPLFKAPAGDSVVLTLADADL